MRTTSNLVPRVVRSKLRRSTFLNIAGDARAAMRSSLASMSSLSLGYSSKRSVRLESRMKLAGRCRESTKCCEKSFFARSSFIPRPPPHRPPPPLPFPPLPPLPPLPPPLPYGPPPSPLPPSPLPPSLRIGPPAPCCGTPGAATPSDIAGGRGGSKPRAIVISSYLIEIDKIDKINLICHGQIRQDIGSSVTYCSPAAPTGPSP